jgi:alpha-tubulin suppressor-like RCC1 family protein
MVAAGAEHSVAITEDGDLYGWGWGQYGNLGLGDTNNRLIPEKVNIDVCPQTYIYYNLEELKRL